MPKLTGPLCPMTDDGRHKLKPWWNGKGLACDRCHKTWAWVEDELVPTYPDPSTIQQEAR